MSTSPNPQTIDADYALGPAIPIEDSAEYQIARDHRDRSAAYFPMPSAGDCALFAATEIGEYLDALIRLHGTAYRRNNARNVDTQAELGQVGYMILSTLIAIDRGDRSRPDERSRRAAILGTRIGLAISAMAGGDHEHARRDLEIAFSIWRHLCAEEGAAPATLIDMITRQIDAKHAPAGGPSPKTVIGDA